MSDAAGSRAPPNATRTKPIVVGSLELGHRACPGHERTTEESIRGHCHQTALPPLGGTRPCGRRGSAVPGRALGELTITNLKVWRTFAPALVAVGKGTPRPCAPRKGVRAESRRLAERQQCRRRHPAAALSGRTGLGVTATGPRACRTPNEGAGTSSLRRPGRDTRPPRRS